MEQKDRQAYREEGETKEAPRTSPKNILYSFNSTFTGPAGQDVAREIEVADDGDEGVPAGAEQIRKIVGGRQSCKYEKQKTTKLMK